MDNQYVHAGDTLVVIWMTADHQVRLQQAFTGGALIAETERGCIAVRGERNQGPGIATRPSRCRAGEALRSGSANEDYTMVWKTCITIMPLPRRNSMMPGSGWKESADQRRFRSRRPSGTEARPGVVDVNQRHMSALRRQNLASRQADVETTRNCSLPIRSSPLRPRVLCPNAISSWDSWIQAGQSLFAVVNANGIYVTAEFQGDADGAVAWLAKKSISR